VLLTDEELGYRVPDQIFEQDRLPITVTDGHSCYDATASGGLRISRYAECCDPEINF
jgi:hypothetical protein